MGKRWMVAGDILLLVFHIVQLYIFGPHLFFPFSMFLSSCFANSSVFCFLHLFFFSMISASMVLGASQCHGIASPLHPDLQQKLSMQASGYTYQHCEELMKSVSQL
jgi:hypothetical protein